MKLTLGARAQGTLAVVESSQEYGVEVRDWLKAKTIKGKRIHGKCLDHEVCATTSAVVQTKYPSNLNGVVCRSRGI